MINMQIKPRRAELESGAIVEDRHRHQLKGFVVETTQGNYKIINVHDDGSMRLSDEEYSHKDIGEFFTTYKVIAQRNGYHGKIEEL